MPLNFSHPLSSIVFRAGTLRDGIIRSITLQGVAGTNYTYTISLSPESPEGITVDEYFDGYTKSNLSISNSSGYNVYIRAMIEANRVNADGDINTSYRVLCKKDAFFTQFNDNSSKYVK